MKLIFKTTSVICLILLSISSTSNAQDAIGSAWQDIAKPSGIAGKRTWMPSKYRFMNLDLKNLKQEFSKAPVERTQLAKSNPVVVEIPMPDGNFQRFKIVETHVMHPDLAKAFPFIKTYSGQGIDDGGATIVMDYTQFGFHAFILSSNGVVYIDPVDLSNTNQYLVYYRTNIGHASDFTCLVDDKTLDQIETTLRDGSNQVNTTGDLLNSYRLALGCTGEYAQFYGGTVAGALAGMVTSVNRVDGIYEKELAISLELIPNDTLLIYTDFNTDGYTNSDPGSLLQQNQFKCNSIIGPANYDIGHVFSTAGGGLASLGVICEDNSKASGETGTSSPIGDGYDVDYVAHEMGHQFGGNHTFNSQTGSCSGNGHPLTAFEPGSGITIMAYAGICGSDDLAPHSIPTFHTISYDEITTYTMVGNGALCAMQNQTGNTPPSVIPPGNYIIPYQTPFRLEATGSDPDGDTVYFSWEQFDHGSTYCAWNLPTGDAPIYRSYNPTVSGLRIFPSLINVLNNSTSKGELRPTYARTMHFRCTVRDNRVGGGGVNYNNPPVSVQAINTGTGFAITDPNLTGITWQALSQQTVLWNVAQTDLAPISTPTVNILLSIDGGYTWPYTLASGIPNTGSAMITVPTGITSDSGRVMVEGAGNIFFDINDKNIHITPGFLAVNETELSNAVSVFPNPANENIQIQISSAVNGNVTLKLTDKTGREIKSELIKLPLQKDSYLMKLTDVASGIYSLCVETNYGILVKKIVKL